MNHKLKIRLQAAKTAQEKLEVAFRWSRARIVHSTQLLGKIKDVFPDAFVRYADRFEEEGYSESHATVGATVDGEVVELETVFLSIYSGDGATGKLMLTRKEAVAWFRFVEENAPQMTEGVEVDRG